MKIEELKKLRKYLVDHDASFSSIQDIFNCLDVIDEEVVKYLIGLRNYLKENHVSLDEIQKELESVDWELEDMRDLMFNKLERAMTLQKSLQDLKKEKKFVNTALLTLGVSSLLFGVVTDSNDGLSFYAFCISLCCVFVSNFNYKRGMKKTTSLLENQEKGFQKVKSQYHDLRKSRRPELSK